MVRFETFASPIARKLTSDCPPTGSSAKTPIAGLPGKWVFSGMRRCRSSFILRLVSVENSRKNGACR
jgi:hypothetical protein